MDTHTDILMDILMDILVDYSGKWNKTEGFGGFGWGGSKGFLLKICKDINMLN